MPQQSKAKTMVLINRMKLLQSRSADAINVFKKAAKQLKTVNTDIDNECRVKQDKIKLLKTQSLSLLETKEANLKVIENINKIIG